MRQHECSKTTNKGDRKRIEYFRQPIAVRGQFELRFHGPTLLDDGCGHKLDSTLSSFYNGDGTIKLRLFIQGSSSASGFATS